MKQISEMTTDEKSSILCLLTGWLKSGRNGTWQFKIGEPYADNYYSHLATLLHYKPKSVTPDLYDMGNMALAWMVLNWAGDNLSDIKPLNDIMIRSGKEVMENGFYSWYMPPSEIQYKWLDKVLELAIKQGLCDELPEVTE